MNTLKQIWAVIKRVCVGYWELCVLFAWEMMWQGKSATKSLLGWTLLLIVPFLVALFYIILFAEPMP